MMIQFKVITDKETNKKMLYIPSYYINGIEFTHGFISLNKTLQYQ